MSTIMEFDVGRDELDRYAVQALTRPSHYAAWDDRWYTTHGCVFQWADRGDDLVAESNYHAMLAELAGAVAHDETGASEQRGDDVEDTEASHWLVGSVREIFVRVYVDPDADEPEYTPAFIRAVELLLSLQDYPLLDESDHSEREVEAWFKVFWDALDRAARDHRDVDDPIDEQLIDRRMRDDHFELMPEVGHPQDLDWDDVALAYDAYRAGYYEWQAQRWLPYEWPATGAPINQLVLDLA